jgi:beta-galactosidase
MDHSRRNFLKSSAALVGGLSLHPMLVRSSVAMSGGPVPAPPDIEEGWEFYKGTLGGPWEVWHLHSRDWQPVKLPHCFNALDACDPDHAAYRGQGWYRRQLRIANPFPNGRTLIHSGGAGQRTTLYSGTEVLGHNIGGYNEFAFDIAEAEQNPDGELQLAILCDNSRDLHTIPSDISDFNLYGGLYRHLRLVYVPAISVEMLHIHSDVTPGSPARCTVQARLHNPEQLNISLNASIQVIGPGGEQVCRISAQLNPWQDKRPIAEFTVSDPRLWSPSSPSLYECRVTLDSQYGQQTCTSRFGLRTLGFEEHGPFLLNGEKLFLRGTQRHEDHAGYAAAVPDDITRREMRMIKDMGANFIRLAHYPQAELVLDLCDELGLVVWEELPWCRAGGGDALMRENACDLLRIMIEQHYNHPSIAFWSLGNEEDWPDINPGDGQVSAPELMQELQNLAHSLDPSRYTSFRRCAPAKDIPDVYSPSIWAGWYSHRYQEYQQMLERNRMTVRHMLHMEWGADSHARRHAEEPYGEPYAPFVATSHGAEPPASKLPIVKNGDWSETYACDLFDWYLKTQETLPWFAGSAQWIFKDFSTPDRPENPLPRVNQKGLTERDLTPKEGYYVFQSYWARQPMVHIYGHSWPVRWGRAGEQRLVRVYSNCESVELYLNGKSLGVRQRSSQDFPCAGLRWSPAFRSGENTLRAVAHSGTTQVEDEIRFTYQTATWGSPAELILQEKSRIGQVVTVEVTLLDARRVLCLDARNRIRFSVAGGGALKDNLGTVTGSRVLELCNGRAEISILGCQQPFIVSVAAEGIPDAFLKID